MGTSGVPAAIAMAQVTLLLGDFAASDRALADAAGLAESLHHLARAWLARSRHLS